MKAVSKTVKKEMGKYCKEETLSMNIKNNIIINPKLMANS
jgi:hypothetical protein